MSISTHVPTPHAVAHEFADLSITGPIHRSPAPIQLVTEGGELTERGRSVDIDLGLARRFHRDMVLARRLDHEALFLQRQGELALWLMCWGQEAAQVGSIRATRETDMVFPSYREHAAALCRGITVEEVLSPWRGARHGGWAPAKYHFHINSLVLGTQTLHATGYATGVAMDGTDEVVLCYFGDGSSSQGDVNEALNWAATHSLPLLFFCQNNKWAISTSTRQQMKTPLHRRARGFGLDAYHVDGNDVLAVHTVTSAALERVRNGGGPALIEASTYRLSGHSTSDDPTRYRSSAEQDRWEARDPISRLESLLRRSGTPDSWFMDLAAEAEEFGAEVRDTCRSIRTPDLDEFFEHVYGAPHPTIDAERAAVRSLTEPTS